MERKNSFLIFSLLVIFLSGCTELNNIVPINPEDDIDYKEIWKENNTSFPDSISEVEIDFTKQYKTLNSSNYSSLKSNFQINYFGSENKFQIELAKYLEERAIFINSKPNTIISNYSTFLASEEKCEKSNAQDSLIVLIENLEKLIETGEQTIILYNLTEKQTTFNTNWINTSYLENQKTLMKELLNVRTTLCANENSIDLIDTTLPFEDTCSEDAMATINSALKEYEFLLSTFTLLEKLGMTSELEESFEEFKEKKTSLESLKSQLELECGENA